MSGKYVVSVGALQPPNILVDMKMWDLSGRLLCLLAQWTVPGRARYMCPYTTVSVSTYYYDMCPHSDSAAAMCDKLLYVSSS